MTFSKWLCASSVALLAGCTTVQSDVTVFHTADVEKPNTFRVTALQPLAGTLEAATYSEMIASQLVAKGWTESPRGEVNVLFGYAIDSGHTETSAMPIFGQTGGGTAQSFGTISAGGRVGTYSGTTVIQPTFGVVGAIPVTKTIYDRSFILDMYGSSSNKKIYESRVTSSGDSGEFSQVAKCLIDALFGDFPGVSGKHHTVTVDGSKCVLAD